MFTIADVEGRLQHALTTALIHARRLGQKERIYDTDRHPRVLGEFCTTIRRELLPTGAPWHDVAQILIQPRNWDAVGVLGSTTNVQLQRHRLVLGDGNWVPNMPKVIALAKAAVDNGTTIDVNIPVTLAQLSAAMPALGNFAVAGAAINEQAEDVLSKLVAALETLNAP